MLIYLIVDNCACMCVAACIDGAFMKHTHARPWPPVIKVNPIKAMVRARPSFFLTCDLRACLPLIGQDSFTVPNVTFSSEAMERAMRTVGSIQSFFQAKSVVAKVAPFV
jgi:hypothetical protein